MPNDRHRITSKMIPPPSSNSTPTYPNTSVAQAQNKCFLENGKSVPRRSLEDRYHVYIEEDKQLYIVLDGHDGSNAADFVVKCLPEKIMAADTSNPGTTVESLNKAFLYTEKMFFDKMDPSLVERAVLQIDLKECSSAEASRLHPDLVKKLQDLDEFIQGGTACTLLLVIGESFYIANVGNVRALLCKLQQNGTMAVCQLSEDHTTDDEAELKRLEELGLKRDEIMKSKRLAMFLNTRSIGDFFLKQGYSDIDALKISKKPPGSAVPHISGPYSLSDVERGFLVLMTDGLYSIASKTDRDCSDVNQAVARMVAREMCGSNTMHSVAQSVISKFQESLHSIFMDSQGERHDCRIVGDCTLLVHNLGFPLGKSETYPESYCTVTPSSMIADKTDGLVRMSSLHSDSDEFDSDEEFNMDEEGIDPKSGFVPAYVKFEMLPEDIDLENL